MFTGFTQADFEVFERESFAERMALLHAEVKPKLIALGKMLAPVLSEIVKEPLFPHVAQHLRRTVNPPVETWVAFGREKRAYKPYVHLRVGINRERVRVTVFVEDYADEKLAFAASLRADAEALAAHCRLHPEILGFEMPGQPLLEAGLTGFADRMERVKGLHAVFGIALSSSETTSLADQLPLWASAQVKTLLPFYRLGHFPL